MMCAQADGFEDAVKALRRKLSCLRQLDGVDATVGFKGVGAGTLAAALARSTEVGGAGDDRSSCSCIEGNPVSRGHIQTCWLCRCLS